MMKKEPQCIRCSHNIRNSSCGPCADKESDIIEIIADDLKLTPFNDDEQLINSYKCSCKILLKYPEDYNVIDPFSCKYFLSSALKFS